MLVDNMSLSSPVKEVRDYWIKHCVNSLKITEYFGRELKQKALMNIWIPDGLKDVPADRYSPRLRLKESLDEVFGLAETIEKAAEIYMKICDKKIIQSISNINLKKIADAFIIDYRLI